MSEPIYGLSKDGVGRLYDFLHTQWAEARDAYVEATHATEEEFYRGRREGIDAVLSELDHMMDEVDEQKSDPVAAERARFLLIAGQCDKLGGDAARDPGMYSGPADGFVWAAEAIRNAVAEAEE